MSEGPIHRLLYVSTLRAEAAAHLQSTVQDILVQSTGNNVRDRLSGLLLCDGVSFAQALEGPRIPLEACLHRIVQDDRHSQVMPRLLEPAEGRSFARWSMCALTLSDADDALLTAADIDFDLRTVAAGALWQHLWSLAQRHALELDTQHAAMMAGIPL